MLEKSLLSRIMSTKPVAQQSLRGSGLLVQIFGGRALQFQTKYIAVIARQLVSKITHLGFKPVLR